MRQLHETIVSTLSRSDSPLRSFEWQESRLSTPLEFENLLRAVEKSKLERFAIGRIRSQQQLRTLTESIPKMRIKELKVVIDTNIGAGNMKQHLLSAAQNNFSLQSVDGKRVHNGFVRDVFDDDDKLRLAFYANRNKLLDQWADHPETIDRKVWPKALKLAEKAGPSSLFQGLRSVLGGGSTGLRVGRKRKRPQYYAPS